MDINRMSREKLLKAGYKFIRMTDYPTKDGIRLQIRYCDNVNFVWKLLEAAAAREGRMIRVWFFHSCIPRPSLVICSFILGSPHK